MNMFKTTDAKTPQEYLDKLDSSRKSELSELHRLITKTVPKLKPFIISGMIGYGTYHYKSASGREGDWCTVALASQKNYISLYICSTDGHGYLPERYKSDLGKVSTGKSCIRFKNLADLNIETVKKILIEAEKLKLS